MTRNRRNYYRILHVQPEAPPEVIKASYRTLMSTLKMHPDLGGDHELASLVNEAYAVLSDRERRAAYDREIGARRLRGRSASPSSGAHADGPASGFARRSAGSTAGTESGPDTGATGSAWAESGGGCAWCQAPLASGTIKPDSRCGRCQAPLAGPPEPGAAARELFGRRGAVRKPRAHLAIMQRRDGGASLSVRLRDLSLTGIGLATTAAVAIGTRVRIQSQDFDAVAVVVASRRDREQHLLHARLLTMTMLRRSGVFVSETA